MTLDTIFSVGVNQTWTIRCDHAPRSGHATLLYHMPTIE